MGVTHDETIKGAVKAANASSKKVLADMMCVEKLEERAKQLVDLGVHYICVHTAFDVQETESPFESLARIQSAVGSDHCAIAGGINANSVNKVVQYKPEIIIVGNGITGQENKKETARMIRNILNSYEVKSTNRIDLEEI